MRTNPDGTTDVVGEAWLRATVGPAQKLLSITTSPDVPALQQLLGGSVGSGFRSRVIEVLRGAGTHESEDGSLLYLLLDDLPGATLVSGYALLRGGLMDDPPGNADPASHRPNNRHPNSRHPNSRRPHKHSLYSCHPSAGRRTLHDRQISAPVGRRTPP